MRRLMVTTIALGAFVAGLFAVGLSAQQRGTPAGLGLGFAVEQAGSPIEIRATLSDAATGAYTKVTVRNTSSKVITGTTFAVRITAPTGSALKDSLREGELLQDRIEPGSTLELSANVVGLEELSQLSRTHLGGQLELGVLRVRFADGSTWASSVRTTGRFGGS